MVSLSSAEVAARRPVWLAMSEMFLDTTLDPDGISRLAKELARSPYSLEELDKILLLEVYPACRGNLLSIAGEWAGFKPDWLEQRMLQGPSMLGAAWAGSVGRLGRCSSMTWRQIKRRFKEEREPM